MKNFKQEEGQGLLEYAIVLVIVVLLVLAIIGLLIYFVVIVPHWPEIEAWGTNLVAGIQRGDPSAILVAAVIIVIILFLLRRR